MNSGIAALVVVCLVLRTLVNCQHHGGYGGPPHGGHGGPPPEEDGGPPRGPPPGGPPLPECRTFQDEVHKKMDENHNNGTGGHKNCENGNHEECMYNDMIKVIKANDMKPGDKCQAQVAEMYGMDCGNKTEKA